MGALKRKAGTYLVVGSFAAALAFPFLWMLITAFKRESDLYNPENVPFVFNEPPTLAHIKLLFFDTPYIRWLWNTGFVGLTVVLITLAFSLPAAYALARLSGRWGQRLGVGIFLTYLVPPTLLFLPMSRVVSTLGLQDSLGALILVYPSFTVPFATWLLMGFFKTLPRDLEEAALVDGCSRLAALRRGLPGGDPGHPHGRHFQLHAGHPRVHLRAHIHQQLGREDDLDRRADRPHPGRRLLLGVAHGGGAHPQHPDRAHVQRVSRPVHLRDHRRSRPMRS